MRRGGQRDGELRSEIDPLKWVWKILSIGLDCLEVDYVDCRELLECMHSELAQLFFIDAHLLVQHFDTALSKAKQQNCSRSCAMPRDISTYLINRPENPQVGKRGMNVAVKLLQ